MRREACHVTSGLITSQPPLRRAKARSSSGRFPPSPPSRPPSVPSFAARLRLRLPLHILIHHCEPTAASVTSQENLPSFTAGTDTALKSIVGPMCAGHRRDFGHSLGFVSTTAGRRKSRPLHFIHWLCQPWHLWHFHAPRSLQWIVSKF